MFSFFFDLLFHPVHPHPHAWGAALLGILGAPTAAQNTACFWCSSFLRYYSRPGPPLPPLRWGCGACGVVLFFALKVVSILPHPLALLAMYVAVECGFRIFLLDTLSPPPPPPYVDFLALWRWVFDFFPAFSGS